MFNDDDDEYIDAVLYGGDNREETHTPYGANGSAPVLYGAVSRMEGRETLIYEGPSFEFAEQQAIHAYTRSYGRAYVSVLRDGGTWRDVKTIPFRIQGDHMPRLTDAGSCLHPRRGEIHPLTCYCADTMTAEERARYADH